jgi:hypothetical protein
LDDQLDSPALAGPDRLSLVGRQWALIERCYRGERPRGLSDEEMLLAELIQTDRHPNSGLQAHIRRMTAVMAFDAERRGRLISEVGLAG